ncbi:MAG: phosphoethanolamine transferase CptA [Gammaproteobacteria bacterium]|nr:phosphoethanolamine transferase CptA [Gammaproteobacteria bacterium]
MRTKLLKNHQLLGYYLFFAFFSVVPQLCIYFSNSSGFVGLRQSILVSMLWLIPILIFPQRAKLIATVIGVPLWLGGITTFGYWLIFGQEFSQSVLFIIFESNLTEGGEFLASYYNHYYLLYFAAFTVVPILIWRSLTSLNLQPSYAYCTAIILALIISWPLYNTWLIKKQGVNAGLDHLAERLQPAAPWNLAVGYVKYREQLAAMNSKLNDLKKIPPLENFQDDFSDTPQTLVLVIGESTNRNRMQLYGSLRQTTPKLSEMSDELMVFTDVVTSRPYTIEALEQALSFADSKSIERFMAEPNLISIMQQAEYDVTWITNQQTQTLRNTLLTTFSRMADHQVYLNNNRSQNANQYDNAVLNPLNKALNTNLESKKKLIVLHLLGTHRKYNYRYPESFNQFTSNNVPNWVGEDHVEEYNAYDNAILFNDYVMSSIIKQLKKRRESTLMVYFSDHGEEVYDTPNALFSGRNEGKPTPAMYTVPFIAWANAPYRASHETSKWQHKLGRPMTTADFIYTWADMVGFDFSGMDYSRSVISDQFVPHHRWIGNPLSPKSLKDYSEIAPTTPYTAKSAAKKRMLTDTTL